MTSQKRGGQIYYIYKATHTAHKDPRNIINTSYMGVPRLRFRLICPLDIIYTSFFSFLPHARACVRSSPPPPPNPENSANYIYRGRRNCIFFFSPNLRVFTNHKRTHAHTHTPNVYCTMIHSFMSAAPIPRPAHPGPARKVKREWGRRK